ncbi:MAG: general secretion pathway protein J [Myxococcota bacterium]|jgi:general secretion pathway protein J
MMGSRRGITLVEVMVAIFLLVVMSAMVFETLSNAIEMNTLLEARDETTRAARVALSRLKREVQMAYLTPNQMAVNTYRTVFVGLDENPDTLYLASLSHQRLYMNSRECDQTEITIWAEDAPEEYSRGDVLYHREAPRIDEEPDEDGPVHPLAYNVRTFNLRYLDPQINEWRDEWDTRGADTPNRLPRAVEIGLVLIGPDPDDSDRTVDVPFLTTVLLHYADRIVNPNDPFGAMLNAGGAGGNPFGAAGGNPFGSGATSPAAGTTSSGGGPGRATSGGNSRAAGSSRGGRSK